MHNAQQLISSTCMIILLEFSDKMWKAQKACLTSLSHSDKPTDDPLLADPDMSILALPQFVLQFCFKLDISLIAGGVEIVTV